MEAIIRRILEREGNVVFGYLFGSVAKGDVTNMSDVDIAVYLIDTGLDARLELHHTLQKALHKEIDLVILNDIKNVYLIESIIFDGIVVKDHPNRLEYEVRKQHEIIDFKMFRKRIDAA
jgi:predicted nucleotidyltransferase